jgi:hypothetical protein
MSIFSGPFISIGSTDAKGPLSLSRPCHIQIHLCVRRVREKAALGQNPRTVQLLQGICTHQDDVGMGKSPLVNINIKYE